MRFSLLGFFSAWLAVASLAFALPTKNKVAQPKSKWNTYVVLFDKEVGAHLKLPEALSLLQLAGAEITHEFKTLFVGFTVKAPDTVAEAVKALHTGISVEQDQVMSVQPVKVD